MRQCVVGTFVLMWVLNYADLTSVIAPVGHGFVPIARQKITASFQLVDDLQVVQEIDRAYRSLRADISKGRDLLTNRRPQLRFEDNLGRTLADGAAAVERLIESEVDGRSFAVLGTSGAP